MAKPKDNRMRDVLSDLWVPAEFRAWRARRRLTIPAIRVCLVERIGESRVPCEDVIRLKWDYDSGPGPRDIEVVGCVADILSCEVSDLCCPVLPRIYSRPTHKDIEVALHILRAELLRRSIE